MIKAFIFLIMIHTTNNHDYFVSYSLPDNETCNTYVKTLGQPDSDYSFQLAAKTRQFFATDAQKIDYKCVVPADIDNLKAKYGTKYVSETINGSPE